MSEERDILNTINSIRENINILDKIRDLYYDINIYDINIYDTQIDDFVDYQLCLLDKETELLERKLEVFERKVK